MSALFCLTVHEITKKTGGQQALVAPLSSQRQDVVL